MSAVLARGHQRQSDTRNTPDPSVTILNKKQKAKSLDAAHAPTGSDSILGHHLLPPEPGDGSNINQTVA